MGAGNGARVTEAQAAQPVALSTFRASAYKRPPMASPSDASSPVRLESDGRVGVIVIDNPPVNASSAAVRAGLLGAAGRLAADATLVAGVIIGAGKGFVAGADIREFDKPPIEPGLSAVIAAIEDCPKPIVAAIHGVALGGGLELALGCDARIATDDAKVGLPEVTLGVIPGAGGTQRLPRLVGIPKAIDLVVSGRRIGAREAAALGIVDAIMDGDLRAGAVAYALKMAGRKRLLRNLPVPSSPPEEIVAAVAAGMKNGRGRESVRAAIAAIESAARLPFADALAGERSAFLRLKTGEEATALRHLFFAERAARKLDGDSLPVQVDRVGIIGGGTMGSGIAAAFAARGFEVALCDSAPAALERARATVATALADLARGDESGNRRAVPVRFVEAIEALVDADLIIEAVFEDMDLKRDVIAKVAALTGPETILASNTSYLDIDLLAAASGAPERFFGLHFFAPAHRMRLLEIVRGRATAPATLATGIEVTRRLGKVAVVAGVCEGFIGNRIFAKYRLQAEFLLEEGASPPEVDVAAEALGFAMGPFAVSDLSGLDIAWRNRLRKASTRDPRERYVAIADRLCERGRLGRKAGHGWYDYDAAEGRSRPSVEVERIIAAHRPNRFRDAPIDQPAMRRRLFGAILNEAACVIEDGIARAAADIDLVFVNGYGFSKFKGGPLFQAARLPPGDIDRMIDDVASATGFGFRRGDLGRLRTAE